MRDALNGADAEREVAEATAAVSLAFEVIGRLVATGAPRSTLIKPAFADRMFDAACSTDPRDLVVLIDDMLGARVTAAAILEFYIPHTARRLGIGWQDDTLSFGAVTMGISRLQSTLRRLNDSPAAPEMMGNGRANLLVILPPGEQHTLGVSVLASRLRHSGYNVSLQIAPSLADLAALIETRHFDGALISIGVRDRVETAAMLTKTLHTLTNGALKVVVGGAVLDDTPDCLAFAGADLVTADLDRALNYLGRARPGMERSWSGVSGENG